MNIPANHPRDARGLFIIDPSATGEHRRVLSKVRDLRVWLVMAVVENSQRQRLGEGEASKRLAE